MPQKMMMIVDSEPAGLRRLERLFGLTHQVLCAASGEEALSLRAHHDVDQVNDPAALVPQIADAVACANDSGETAGLDALAPDRLAPLRLTRADLARVHEMTTEVVGGRFNGDAA